LKFDVVSHSMGGLLLRYYLRYGAADLPEGGSIPEVTWAGAANIDRAILIAPPNAGTLESLAQLLEGRNYGPFVSYSPTLLGTFPSGYQMLPRGRHGMVLTDGTPVDDLFDPELWRRMQWGLAAPEAEEMISWLLPDELDPVVRRRIARSPTQGLAARGSVYGGSRPTGREA
jgi:pimeloyl-ACP methyl ester carboxylesterase